MGKIKGLEYGDNFFAEQLFFNQDNMRDFLVSIFPDLYNSNKNIFNKHGITIEGGVLILDLSNSNFSEPLLIDLAFSETSDPVELGFVFMYIYKLLFTEKELVKSWEKQDIFKPPIKYIAKSFDGILQSYGWDTQNDPNMRETGKRLAKSWVDIFKGTFKSGPKITTFNYNEMLPDLFPEDIEPPSVFVGPIEIKSTCSHHMLPIVGSVWIEYIPTDNNVLGLSKLPRLAKHLAARPMIQELYTELLAHELQQITNSPVAVYVRAKHFCAYLRGVEDHSSEMETQHFIDYTESQKQEFLQKILRKG